MIKIILPLVALIAITGCKKDDGDDTGAADPLDDFRPLPVRPALSGREARSGG